MLVTCAGLSAVSTVVVLRRVIVVCGVLLCVRVTCVVSVSRLVIVVECLLTCCRSERVWLVRYLVLVLLFSVSWPCVILVRQVVCIGVLLGTDFL